MGPEPILGSSFEIRDTVILSEVRFVRECLAEVLTPLARFGVCRQAATLDHALLALMETSRPGTVLQDVTFPGGPCTASRICAAFPAANVIALGGSEMPEDVIAWAEAGIAGYIPNAASVKDLVALLERINRRERAYRPRVTGGLVQPDSHSRAEAASAGQILTEREQEIFRLVGSGLCNKDIARRLGISLGTTKTHVHNLLGKLSLRRRAEVMVRMRSTYFAAEMR
jgi:two-component system, NarL family, nitrate/nitrite response regulator NarL